MPPVTSQHTVQELSIIDLIKDHRFSLISQSKERELSDTDLNIRVFFFHTFDCFNGCSLVQVTITPLITLSLDEHVSFRFRGRYFRQLIILRIIVIAEFFFNILEFCISNCVHSRLEI